MKIKPPLLKWFLAACMLLLAGCAPSGLTQALISRNMAAGSQKQNHETLRATQARTDRLSFGLAPLLTHPQGHLEVITQGDVHTVWLVYPRQPPNPVEWSGGDSFVAAYAARQTLVGRPGVRSAHLGSVSIDASIEQDWETLYHTAVWVTFENRSQAILDVTPLAEEQFPRHRARLLKRDGQAIEQEFSQLRGRTQLRLLRPLRLLRQGDERYIVLAKARALADRYEFVLQAHRVRPATAGRPLSLWRGVKVTSTVSYHSFSRLQSTLLAGGPAIFNEQPALLVRQGDGGRRINAILDDQLDLLWHLMTRLEHPASLTPRIK